jgi:polyhydroxyalkanoate synthase subunit PhaC
MKNKDTTFPYAFFENFAKIMTESTSQQNDWWQRMGLTLQNQKQFQDFASESQNRLQDFMEGVKLYQQMDFKRDVKDPPVIWAMGSCKVFDYSQTQSPDAPVLLVIPSLINRAYVLDLTEDTSFLRTLAAAGIRPFLLDWGELSNAERNFSMEDYLNRYLLPALDHVGAYTQKPVSVLGYCIGGMLAMAAVASRPNIEKLILLASPWDFHEGQEWLIPWVHASSVYLNTMIDQSAELPVEIIQYMFAILNPLGVIRKFRELPQFKDNIEKLQEFATVEDWLNDCVPLAPKVAKELLFDWYRDNKPENGQWQINGHIINPKNIAQPTLIIIPQNDKIVSPKSAESLTKSLPNNYIIRPDTGHIGAIIGKKSNEQVLQPIIGFIKEEKKDK